MNFGSAKGAVPRRQEPEETHISAAGRTRPVLRVFAQSTFLLDSLLLLCLACFLIKPLFRLKYVDNWPSIESTFISGGRMLSEHLPHPGWQPLWYCGTRTDYIYPPALLYGTALVSRIGHVLPARAYHLYTAVFYVLGIAAVYWLVRIGSASRASALLSAVATALLSPSFLFLANIRHGSAYWVPQRLHVLMAWGEGPHISALSVLPAALAVTFLALRKWRPAAFAAAAALCALVVANNFYGATSLAFFFPVVVWSVWVSRRRLGVLLRAAGIVLLAYGLSAFWLTPSYIRITMLNLKWVSQPGNLHSLLLMLIALALYGLLSWRFGRGRPDREWSVFVIGSAVIFSVYVLGFFYFGLVTTGDPARLVPELDLALILCYAELARILWKSSRLRIGIAVVTLIAFIPAVRYLTHPWSPFPNAGPVENVYEYQTARWVHDNLPGERVLPSGSIRFWFDAWSDNAQPDGGSMQGMLDQIIPVATFQIEQGSHADLAILWLQALGTSAVVVPAKTSPEAYHDYSSPEKFRGVIPVLYDDRRGTVIYRIPRINPGIVRIVDIDRMKQIGPIRGGDDNETLTQYVTAVEDPAQPAATMKWQGPEEAEIKATANPGQSLLVQETWDAAWHAWENGRELPVRLEPVMGFMLIDLPAGEHTIDLRFQTPLENRVGEGLFALSALAAAILIALSRN